MMKKILILISLCYTGIAGLSQNADSLSEDIFSMDLEELMNTKVTIATKSEQLISESPSTISVITSEDIKNMGARQLEDILQVIPGYDIAMTFNSYYTAGIRGVRDSRNTSKLLVMMDGIPINQVFYGCMINYGYDINIDAIERIEFIRGPGSALYGRNAFSGVINIITKKAKPGNNIMGKGNLGSFNTKMISGYYGYKNKRIELMVAAKRLYTDYSDAEFEGKPYEVTRNNTALNTHIRFDKFTLSGIFLDLKNELFTSHISHKPAFYSLSYVNDLGPKISNSTTAYGHNSIYFEDIELIAPEVMTYYPLGLYVRPQVKEYQYGVESEWRLKITPNHDLLAGIQADLHGVYDVILESNADSLANAMPYPIPGIGRNNLVRYEPGWFQNNGHRYQNIAFLVQEIWKPLKSMSFTFGARYDFDSQIGSQLNPRIGFVYEPTPKSNLKILYGRAYRAPCPAEQYTIFGFAFGNAALKPEVIHTFEIAGSYRYNYFSNSINLFWNDIKDIIYAPVGIEINPDFMYHNIGENVSRGIEYENKFAAGKWFQAFLNASYTVSENRVTLNDKDSVYNHPDVAPFKINFGMNYMFLNYFSWNLNMFYRSKMEKFYAPDPISGNNIEVQDPIGNYAILNTTIRVKELIRNIDFSATLYNIFDTKYYSQDNQHLHQPSQPGRQLLFNITYAY
jgi:outer membrane receptor for ferrienterochelin and colicin